MPTETDALILKIIEEDRLATGEEIAAIVSQVAQASFSERLLPLRTSFRAQLAAAGHQFAAKRLPWLFVIYRPRFGAIVSGFQASGPEAVFSDEFDRLRKHR